MFRCEPCERQFKTNQGLIGHERLKHGIESAPAQVSVGPFDSATEEDTQKPAQRADEINAATWQRFWAGQGFADEGANQNPAELKIFHGDLLDIAANIPVMLEDLKEGVRAIRDSLDRNSEALNQLSSRMRQEADVHETGFCDDSACCGERKSAFVQQVVKQARDHVFLNLAQASKEEDLVDEADRLANRFVALEKGEQPDPVMNIDGVLVSYTPER